MRTEHSLKLMLRVVQVSRLGFYEWRNRKPRVSSELHLCLKEKVKTHFRASRGTYGYRSIQRGLMKDGVILGRPLILRHMRHSKKRLNPKSANTGSVECLP